MMVASKYNSFFTHDNHYFGYNSYTNEYILLDATLYQILSACFLKNDFSELEECHIDFFSFLKQQGFLVGPDIDEFERVKEKSRVVDNDDTNFHLIVNPTMNCNFKCWYCYETHIKDSKMDKGTIDALIRLCENVLSNQKRIKTFSLSFFGGEPLLYFEKVIKPLLKEMSLLCAERNVLFYSSMTTNGLLINSEMLTYASEYGMKGLQITLDGNRDQHDKVRYIAEGKGSYDRIVENIILAAKNGIEVIVRINCSLATMDNIDEILVDFRELPETIKNNIKFDFQKVWQEEADISLALKAAKSLFSSEGYVSKTDHMASILDSCYADKRYQATVNYDGEVFKCTARDFKSNSGEGFLTSDGKIVWNEKYERRLNVKFNNVPCKECRILPICGGGCTQAALEAEGKEYCVMGFDEHAKTQLIIDRLTSLIEA